MQLCNGDGSESKCAVGQLQTLWFLNLLIRQVLKCTTLLPANPALPMVEVTVLLVVKKC